MKNGVKKGVHKLWERGGLGLNVLCETEMRHTFGGSERQRLGDHIVHLGSTLAVGRKHGKVKLVWLGCSVFFVGCFAVPSM